ncbi:MAG: hypothetical protein L0Z07_08075, partial [Planctomycetes bacterium]|nr:hypothetical protein [Planctomycetota bacterium]
MKAQGIEAMRRAMSQQGLKGRHMKAQGIALGIRYPIRGPALKGRNTWAYRADDMSRPEWDHNDTHPLHQRPLAQELVFLALPAVVRRTSRQSLNAPCGRNQKGGNAVPGVPAITQI